MIYTLYRGRRSSPRVTKMVKNKADLKGSPHRSRSASRSSRRSVTRPKSAQPPVAKSSGNVKVVVRVRPPNSKELGDNHRLIVKVIDDNVVVFDPKENCEPFFYHGVQQKRRDLLKKAKKNIQFTFDKVFGYDSNNDDVFTDSTKSLIMSLMDGYNCSVFVYGATGAGKTYTMLGHNDNPGITFLTMQLLFEQMEELKEERNFELGITYLEVYNETVKDLLNPGGPLHLREDGKYGVCVAGIKLHRIQSPAELFALLAKGNCNRTQHPTDSNAESSRSHAVFQVYVNMSGRNDGERRIAKLSMIDLAGSERGAATGCKGMRFTEGANINKSLLALGNCINSLADGQRHIPYRDSKLTRLLKDSLGGNCRTVMIANVSPSSSNYEDTYNTLKYATRAKKIKSNMKKNVVNCELTIPQYMKLVEELNEENATLKAQLEEKIAAAPCACNGKGNQPKEEPAWTEQLRNLLKEKRNLDKHVQQLFYVESALQLKIKFKESFETVVKRLWSDEDQPETGRNRIFNSAGLFQRQAGGLLIQIEDIQNQLKSIDEHLELLIKQEDIPIVDNIEMLKNELELQTTLNELGMEHRKKTIELFQFEMDHREKLMSRMVEVVHLYYQLLRGHGHVTKDMTETYRSLTKGLRSVTWLDENDVPSTRSQDSGVSVSSTTNPSMQKIDFDEIQKRLNLIQENHLTKGPKVKRRLDDGDVISGVTCLNNMESPAKIEPTTAETNLNRTIELPKPTINTDLINNTFSISHKEPAGSAKKSTSKDTKAITADNLLPKAYKHLSSRRFGQIGCSSPGRVNKENKQLSAVGRNQRFPLRNKCQDSDSKPGRATRIVNNNGRLKAVTSQR